MEEVCQVCGLPKNICVCTQITKEAQKIKVRMIKRTFGKTITIISGIDNQQTAKQLEKVMKRKLACGGTTKGTEIELQGDHKKKVKKILIEEGYKEDSIDDK
jgi:translation initiation factor 1